MDLTRNLRKIMGGKVNENDRVSIGMMHYVMKREEGIPLLGIVWFYKGLDYCWNQYCWLVILIDI